MKNLKLLFTLLLVPFIFSCSSDDDSGGNPSNPGNEPETIFVPSKLEVSLFDGNENKILISYDAQNRIKTISEEGQPPFMTLNYDETNKISTLNFGGDNIEFVYNGNAIDYFIDHSSSPASITEVDYNSSTRTYSINGDDILTLNNQNNIAELPYEELSINYGSGTGIFKNVTPQVGLQFVFAFLGSYFSSNFNFLSTSQVESVSIYNATANFITERDENGNVFRITSGDYLSRGGYDYSQLPEVILVSYSEREVLTN